MARKSSQEPLWVTNDVLNTKCSVKWHLGLFLLPTSPLSFLLLLLLLLSLLICKVREERRADRKLQSAQGSLPNGKQTELSKYCINNLA